MNYDAAVESLPAMNNNLGPLEEATAILSFADDFNTQKSFKINIGHPTSTSFFISIIIHLSILVVVAQAVTGYKPKQPLLVVDFDILTAPSGQTTSKSVISPPHPMPQVPKPVIPEPVVPTPIVPTPVVPTPIVPTPIVPTPIVPTPIVPKPVVLTPIVPKPIQPRQLKPMIRKKKVVTPRIVEPPKPVAKEIIKEKPEPESMLEPVIKQTLEPEPQPVIAQQTTPQPFPVPVSMAKPASPAAQDNFSPPAKHTITQAAAVADPQPQQRQKESALSRYTKANYVYVRKTIQKKIRYPRIARRMGWEGKVVVEFVVGANGTISDLKIIKSSGFKALDNNATATIEKAAPFPNPPAPAKLRIPVVYQLRNSN